MKLVMLAGQPFIRAGSRTLTPIDALGHFKALADEARREVELRDQERKRVRLQYHHALETGAPFDRGELIRANQRVAEATALWETANLQTQDARSLLTTTQAQRAVSGLQADIEAILSRFPVDQAA